MRLQQQAATRIQAQVPSQPVYQQGPTNPAGILFRPLPQSQALPASAFDALWPPQVNFFQGDAPAPVDSYGVPGRDPHQRYRHMSDGTWVAVQPQSEQAPSQVHTSSKADSPNHRTGSGTLIVLSLILLLRRSRK